MNRQTLILASTSPFRKALLERLQIPFLCAAPEIDESPLPGEPVDAMVVRLATAKARKVAQTHPDALIIGSDQSAVCNGEILHKPGNFENARRQLLAASGQTITFQTGLCLFNAATQRLHERCVSYQVTFRELSEAQIDGYLQAEQPYNCAGSFKSEGLGIMLFSGFSGSDPNALIGLPLIQLIDFLYAEGVTIPAAPTDA